MLSGDRPDAAGRQPTPVGAVRRPAALHRRPREPLGRAEIAAESLTDALAADGAAPYAIPIGGQHRDRRARLRGGVRRADGAVRGGRHRAGGDRAHVVERRHPRRARRRSGAVAIARSSRVPEVLAIGVAKGVNLGMPDVARARRRGAGVARSVATRRSTRPTCRLDDRLARRRLRRADGSRRRRDALGGRRTAVGSSTARTPARASPACSATRPPAAGRPAPTCLRPHRRHARRVRPRRRPLAQPHVLSASDREPCAASGADRSVGLAFWA